jgi:hypothetical protein
MLATFWSEATTFVEVALTTPRTVPPRATAGGVRRN